LYSLEKENRKYNEETRDRKASYQVITVSTNDFKGHLNIKSEGAFKKLTGSKAP